MQAALRTTGLQSAGRAQLPRVQRGCAPLRAYTPAFDAISAKDQPALAVATLLASTVVTIATASPALAEEAMVAVIAPATIETNTSRSNGEAEGAISALEAPALQVAAEPVAVAETTTVVDAVAAIDAESLPLAPIAAASEKAPVPEVLLVLDEEVAPAPEVLLVLDEEVAPAPQVLLVLDAEEAPTLAVVEQEVSIESTPVALAEVESVAVFEEPVVAADVAEAVALDAAVVESEAPAVEVVTAEEADQLAMAMTTALAVEAEAAPTVEEAPVAAVFAEVTPVEEEAAPVVAASAEEPAPTVLEAVEPFVPVPVAAAASAAPEAALGSATEPGPAVAVAAPPVSTSGFDLTALLSGAASGSGNSAEKLTYSALGAAALSFIGTFFVAPRFRDSFKEPTDWRDMYTALKARGVKTVTSEEAYAKAKKGAVLLDVRLADKFEAKSADGSVSVPLYQPIAGWDPASNVRRAGFAFFGIFGTELNENFAAEVAAKIPKNKEIIVMCETGGTIENKSGTQFGFQSRSLKALYYLQQAGYTKVLHMKGGLGDWQRAGLPLSDGSSQPGSLSTRRNATTNGRVTVSGRGTSSGRVTVSPRGTTSGSAGTRSGTGKGTASPKVTAAKELVSTSSRRR